MNCYKFCSVMILVFILVCGCKYAFADENNFKSEKLNSLAYSASEILTVPFIQEQSHDCAVGVEDGVNTMYVVSSAKPAILNVFDMDNVKLLRSFELEGVGSCREHNIDAEGNVYIIGSENAVLYRYSPKTKGMENLGSIAGQSAAYQSVFDDEGNLYIGTYPNGYVVKFNPKTNKFTNLGTAKAGNDYVRSLSYQNGYLWAGSNGTGNAVLVRIDPDTGSKKNFEVPIQPDKFTEVTNIYTQMNLGRYVLTYGANGKGNNCWMVFDYGKEQWTDICVTNGGGGIYASPLIDGKSYFPTATGMKYFDVNTCTVGNSPVTSTSVSSRKYFVVNFKKGLFDGFDENTLVTVSSACKPILINVTTGKVMTVANAKMNGGAISIQNLICSSSDVLYSGAYLGSTAMMYNLKSDNKSYISMGQTESIKEIEGKIYFGEYPAGVVKVYDPSKASSSSNPKKIITFNNEQDRPYIIDGNERYIVSGSVATYGKLGGALAIYDNQSDTYNVIRNIVYEQSIVGLAIKGNLIYGSTTVSGGLGIEPTQKNAKIFVYDILNKRKIAEFIPDFPDSLGDVKIIGDLEFGPDGLLWGATQGCVFAINPDTYETEAVIQVGSCKYTGADHFWRPEYLRFSGDGLLYVTSGNGAVIDIDTKEYLLLDNYTNQNIDLMDIDSEGNVYFSSAGTLKYIRRISGELKKIDIELYTDGVKSNLGGINSSLKEITNTDTANILVIANPFYHIKSILLNGVDVIINRHTTGLYRIKNIIGDSVIKINIEHN